MIFGCYVLIWGVRDVEGNGVIYIVKNVDVDGVFDSEVNKIRKVDLSLYLLFVNFEKIFGSNFSIGVFLIVSIRFDVNGYLEKVVFFVKVDMEFF